MLSKSSLSASFPLADMLAAKGWALRPVAETPLAQLVDASLAPAQTLAGVDPSVLETRPDIVQLLIDGSQHQDPNGVYVHDTIMETSVKAISDVITFNLHLARNVVNPAVLKVAQETKDYIDSRTSSSLAPMTVVPFNYKPIWNSPILLELVSRYATVAPQNIALTATNLKPTVPTETLAMTGAGRFDEEIAQFLADFPANYVQTVWDRLFGPNPCRTLNDFIGGNRDRANDTLLAFLIARRVIDEVPEGVDMDLEAWRAYASGIMAQAGRQVAQIIDRRELERKTLLLVFKIPSDDQPVGEIVVNGDLYPQWLKDGGSPEVLFGAMLAERRFGYRELLANAQRLTTTWKNEYNILQSKIAFQKFNYLVEGLRQSVTRLINETPESELKAPREVFHQLLRDRLQRVKARHLEDIYGIARKMVCRTLYAYTDAEQVLDAIDAAAKANPELDVREAALLGTLDFVSSWLCKFITVQSGE